MKSIRLTFIYLIAFMFLTAGAFALAGESGAAPSYVYIIDDTRPAANAPEAAAYVDELSKLIAILGGEDDGETAFELRALSDPQNKAYSFTAERFNPDELLYWLDEAAGSVYADAPDTAFIDALKADSFVIWVMPQTDEAQLMDNYLMQENHVSQRKTDADDVAQSSFDEAMDLYSQGLEKINAFDEAIRNDDRLLVSDSFGADEAFDAALSIMSHGQREGFGSYKGGFVTGEGLDAENIQEYFIVSNRPFSVDGETAEALFGGVHYAYVSLGGVNIEGDSESAFAVITKTAELRLIQFESRQEPYRWGETVEAVYHIDGQDGTVSAEGWKAYAVVSGGDGAVNALIDCEVQGEEISFEYAPNEFGAYSYTVHALNTLTGDELTADEAAFSVENEAPVLSAADGVIMRLDASALPAGQAQSVDLNAYYTDDRDISTLSYYVGGEPVSGGVYTVDPGDYKQDAELSVRAVDTSGAENTQGRIIVTYHHANELARMINSGANAEIQNIGWEDDRELELRSDIELTDEGRRISAAGEGDVWQVLAHIYKDDEPVITVEMSLLSADNGHWTYTDLYEINAYGSYSISYTACVRDMEGEALEGRSESYGLNNEPPQLKAQNGNIATLKAAGLIYEEETYSFDLRDYYSDDRDGEYLTYEFRSEDGEEYTSRSDYAEIDGNVITFKPENLTSSFSVQIRATDAEGEQNDEGYFEIQYTPVSEAASLKPLAFEKNTNDIAWQERRLSLTYAISLTEAGQSLPAKDTGDIWLVEAKVYAGEQLVDTLRLEMVSCINGQWTYGTEYELGNYGGYKVICTASMAGARDQQLAPVKTDFNVFNTAPALADAYEGRIATVKAAGLMYQNENYKFDLNAYYTDDRDASSLDYEFMLDDGSYTKGGAEDFAEINGSTIEFRNEKIHGPLTVKIRATDSLGEQNDEGYFEIQYKSADEIAEIYLWSPSASEKEKFKWQEELFEIKCEIRVKDGSGQSIYNNKQTDWSVEYSVQLKDAASDEPAYYKLSSYSDISSGHKGTVTTGIIADSGTYVVHLKATNNDTGAVLTKDVTVEIEDEPPKLVEEKLEDKEFGILKTYYASALDPNEDDEIILADHYYDRKDEEKGRELTFSTEQLSSQYSIEGSRIRIYTNLFKENRSIVISAEDSSKQVNRDGRIQV
ncbi:MAG: hypothetical protein II920_10785, partial [Clostridia bacterium]|nr:hypothetical protein [Clostridia bacterium]